MGSYLGKKIWQTVISPSTPQTICGFTVFLVPQATVRGGFVPTQSLYVEALTPNTSECDYV